MKRSLWIKKKIEEHINKLPCVDLIWILIFRNVFKNYDIYEIIGNMNIAWRYDDIRELLILFVFEKVLSY